MSAPESNAAGDHRSAASVRSLEVVTAAVLFALGAVVIADSLRIGAGWNMDGPQSGYFPFYIGIFLCLSSLINFWHAIRDPQTASESFLTRHQASMVMSLLIPTTVFVIVIGFIGIYVASALLIGWFMVRLGKFNLARTIPIAVGVPAVLFALFELWFKMPLPKGPLEQLFGVA
jgi:putative tricarboxylic transport membrane protein